MRTKKVKTKPDLRYAIHLQNKWTGEEIWLGTQYKTYEKAGAAAKVEVCLRCNRYSIVPILSGLMWINKYVGFGDARRALEIAQKYLKEPPMVATLTRRMAALRELREERPRRIDDGHRPGRKNLEKSANPKRGERVKN